MRIKRNKACFSGSLKHMRGFTIIEFLVASALGIIVLVAVGSGYFATQRLNDVASARLNVQQDLRNASNLIVRDARMAGSFGCFNLGNTKASVNSDAGGNEAMALHGVMEGVAGTQTAGVKLMRNGALFNGVNNFESLAADTPVLLFQYGVGSASVTNAGGGLTINREAGDPLNALNDRMPLIISSCLVLDRPSSFNVGGNSINTISPALSTAQNAAEMSVMRYVVNAYTIGEVTGASPVGLYRFQLNDQGGWDGPELLIRDIENMNVLFGYVNNCGNANESFAFFADPQTGANAGQPALLRISLSGAGGAQTVTANVENSTPDDGGAVNIYNIDATIRGGNVCADR